MSLFNFTTQQLQGGGKYSVKAKIGNWYEDMVMDETKFKDYVNLKESNGLLVSSKEEKYEKMLAQIPWNPFPNSMLTTGHYFMLLNQKTEGFMVIDIDDKNLNYNAAFAVTTNPWMNFPCARSLFKFEKFIENKQMHPHMTSFPPSQICYGDKICIMAYPAMYKNPLYLFSTLISPTSFSRFSRNQEVLATEDQNYYNCWTLEHPDSSIRFSVTGKPVAVTDQFVVRHCATGALLASDLVDYYNDYGHEFEISCKNFWTPNKYQQIEAEKGGRWRIDTKMKSEFSQNIWYIIDKN